MHSNLPGLLHWYLEWLKYFDISINWLLYLCRWDVNIYWYSHAKEIYIWQIWCYSTDLDILGTFSLQNEIVCVLPDFLHIKSKRCMVACVIKLHTDTNSIVRNIAEKKNKKKNKKKLVAMYKTACLYCTSTFFI